MAKRFIVLTLLLAAETWLFGLAGQTPGGGNLHGVVMTTSGTPLAGVRVTVFKGDKSAATASTDASGAWAAQVAAGRYRIRLELDGFAATEVENVQAPGDAGQTTLSPATSTDSTNQPEQVLYRPVVDPDQTQQADFISVEQIENLPLDARNYLDLAALTPAVALINNYVGVSDTPLVQAPQSGLSFGGSNGRGNAFWLDGGENNINSGGARPSISQEAVTEFHVDRSNYSAEFGGGLGGIVNIISKSGSNGVHGDVFGFLRSSDLDARNYFDLQKPSYTRSQVGGTLSSALRKDRTFIFLSFERLERKNEGYSLLGRESGIYGPTASQQQVLNALPLILGPQQGGALAAGAGAALSTATYPRTLGLFNANQGNFPFGESNSVGSVRIDHRITDNNNGFLRFNASSGFDQNSQIDGQKSIGRAQYTDFSDATLLLNDTDVLSERLVSESRLSFNRFRYGVRNQDQIDPAIDISGDAYLGPDYTLPARFSEWHVQFKQNMFYTPGKHSIRFGIDFNPVHDTADVVVARNGYFTFGSYLPFGAFLNTASGNPNFSTILAGAFAQSGQPALAQALNDPLTGLQAYSLGIPASYTQAFGAKPFQGWFQRYNFYFNDVYKIHPRLTLNAGVRYELEHAAVLGTDFSPIAPRIGLAWDAAGDNKTVIRAGYGLFFLQDQVQIAAAEEVENSALQVTVPLTGLPGTTNPRTGQPVTSADIYQTLLAEGILGRRPVQASDLAQFGIVPSLNGPFSIRFAPTNNLRHGYSEQASLEIARAVGKTAISAAYNFNRGAHLPRLIDLNQGHGPLGPDGEPTLVPINPLIGQELLYEAASNSYYHALILQAVRRFQNLTFDAHYTFSKSIDDTTDINFLPNDSLEPQKERGLSTFDQRHRFVASAVWTLPSTAPKNAFARIYGGFIFSSSLVASSGRPFNVLTGNVGYDTVYQRPAGAGRNIGHGPPFSSWDLRISRNFALTERTHLEIIAEGFNILNTTNFLRLNNIVGDVAVSQLPSPLVGFKGGVNQPLAFVSALDPRVIQLALKVKW